MRSKAQTISAQRLDRLLAWSRLWLLRIAAWIVKNAGAWAPLERHVHKPLAPAIAKLGKIICALIVLKANARIEKPRKAARDTYLVQNKKRRVSLTLRRIFGSRLRKLSRAHDLRAKISALFALLNNAEREIALAAKRIAKGLTRRCGGMPKSAFAFETVCFGAFSIDVANTS